MSWTPTDEQAEKGAEALADDWNPSRDPILTAMFRDYANTVLAAVGPMIAAQARADERAQIAARMGAAAGMEAGR